MIQHDTTKLCNTPNLVDLTGNLSWLELHRIDINKTFLMKKTSSTIYLSNWLAATYNGFKEGRNRMNWWFLFGDQASVISPFDPYQRSLSTLRLLFSMLNDLILKLHPNALDFFSNYHDHPWSTNGLRFFGETVPELPNILASQVPLRQHTSKHIKHMDENWMVKLLNYRWQHVVDLCERNHHPLATLSEGSDFYLR